MGLIKFEWKRRSWG